MSDFITALKSGNLEVIRSIPKSDLHNHGMMGGSREMLQEFHGAPVSAFDAGHKGVEGINEWIFREFLPVMSKKGVFEFVIGSAFKQALKDGVTVLEMSIDAGLGNILKMTPVDIAKVINDTWKNIAPGIDFRPELGFSKKLPMRTVFNLYDKFLETGFFRGIDLYDIEDIQPVENFRELYRFAKKNGIKTKAHAGEFGDAESVRKTVEVLDLDAVQHGIGAADSVDVMKWLAARGVQLNVCPASNIALKRVETYAVHPIRVLFDHGVNVTVNTDDVLIFEQGNSEQFLELFRCGLFSANELDSIRLNGLKS